MPEINKRGDSQSTGDEGVVGAMLVVGTCDDADKELGRRAVGHDAVQRKTPVQKLGPHL